MKLLVVAVLALAMAGQVRSECANACSGHGNCASQDQCECYPGWQAADCSERTCPFGLSFVDTPQGDLNHDGSVAYVENGVEVQWNVKKTWELYPQYGTNYDPTTDEAHFYAECSNKGLCDRAAGLCQCFEGYEGSSCQRTTCPNECSGHGVCRTVGEIATGALNGRVLAREADHTWYEGVRSEDIMASSYTYNLWDADKNQACWCDPGYSGSDCSLRECPRGDDPLSNQAADCLGATCAVEKQVITYTAGAVGDAGTGYFKFTDWTSKEWSSTTFAFGGTSAITAATLATNIETALEGIPNGVLADVGVSCATSSNSYACTVTFTSNPGNVDTLTWVEVTDGGALSAAITSTHGNEEEVTCSYRGLCDYETGLCKCFKGYYGDDCSMQSTLAL